MTLHILSKQDTVLNKFIAQIRDKSVQKDSMRFRRNLERIGEITAYEISKELAYSPRVVETPLGEAEVGLIDDQVVVATILRAGLPYHQGFLNYFDDAENAFVSAYRKSTKDGKFTVKVEYISCGDLEGKVLLRPWWFCAAYSSARSRSPVRWQSQPQRAYIWVYRPSRTGPYRPTRAKSPWRASDRPATRP